MMGFGTWVSRNIEKYRMKGGAHLLMCAVPLEAAYHGIRRTRYAGDNPTYGGMRYPFKPTFSTDPRASRNTEVVLE